MRAGRLKFPGVALKVILPIVTIVASIAAARWLIATKPPPAEQTAAGDPIKSTADDESTVLGD